MTQKTKKNKLGYYESIPRPASEFLENYYENKYYQSGTGGSLNYTEEEIHNIENKQNELYRLLDPLLVESNKSICDVGCGEGWNLKFFTEKGWQVTGIDISNFGILEKNPSLVKNFTKTALMDGLYGLEQRGKLFNVILCMNVLEHVLEPIKLIAILKKLLKTDGLLVIQIPNDYSFLQLQAVDKGLVNDCYWVTPPDHLNYFNKDSLVKLLGESGLFCKDLFSNFPIEFYLFNEATNYQKTKTVGKSVHNSRVSLENIISTIPFEFKMNLYRAFAEAGLGRNITGIFQKNATV